MFDPIPLERLPWWRRAAKVPASLLAALVIVLAIPLCLSAWTWSAIVMPLWSFAERLASWSEGWPWSA